MFGPKQWRYLLQGVVHETYVVVGSRNDEGTTRGGDVVNGVAISCGTGLPNALHPNRTVAVAPPTAVTFKTELDAISGGTIEAFHAVTASAKTVAACGVAADIATLACTTGTGASALLVFHKNRPV